MKLPVTPHRLLLFTAATALALVAINVSEVRAQAPAASGNGTRQGVLDSARDGLAADATPPVRTRVHRWLAWYDDQQLLDRPRVGWHGIHLAGGSFPAGAGTALGVGVDRSLTGSDPDPALHNRVAISARAAYSTSGYVRGATGISARNLGGLGIDVEGLGQYYEYPQEDFFGLGGDSREEDRTNYLVDAVEAGGRVHWRRGLVDVGGGLTYLRPRLGRGTDRLYPSIEQRFDPTSAPALGARTELSKVDLSGAVDWRDTPSLPRAGGRYAVDVAHYDDRDANRFDFDRVEVDLQQYVPLASRYRRLALRAEGVFTSADEGMEVPFFLQPTLGGASSLRGFREFRFRDRNSVLVGAEYQWEAWWALDAAFFVDAGTVAPSRRSLSMRDMDVSYGIGFRFHSNRAFVGRLDLAFSREGFIPLLRFEHAF